MKTVYETLKELKATPSTNDKLEILKNNKDYTLLKDVLVAALNPDINYWIKKIPDYEQRFGFDDVQDLQWGLDSLDKLSNRTYTGHQGIEFLKNILENLFVEDAYVIERIIGRDLRCGTGRTLSNKAWKKLIPEMKVMLARPFEEKTRKFLKYPALLKTKKMECGFLFLLVIMESRYLNPETER